MKKGIYIVVVLITIYLNLVYEWHGGTMIFMAELIFFLFCVLMAYLGKRGIAVRMQMDKIMIEQRETCKVRISLRNRMPFPIPVKIMFRYRYIAGGKEEKQVYRRYLEGKHETEMYCEVTPEYCGKLELQVQKVVCYDVAGICSASKRVKEKLMTTVMPKPYPVSLIISSRTRWFPVDGESYAQDRSGEDSAEVYNVREYQAGDRMQKVHWKLSAREDTLYIKEFSYPLGAAVILLLQEDESGHGVSNAFLEAAVTISTALVERECVHYVVWKKCEEDGIKRMLIRSEEDLYACIMEILEFSKHCLEREMEEQYRYVYKNDTYAAIIKLDTGMYLQVNQNEKMNMMQEGLETFFHTVEIVV